MAITRAQQAKQMLQDGGMLVKPGFGGTRQGYRGPGGYRGGPGGSAGKGKEDKASSDKGDTREQYSVASTMGTSPRSVSDLRVERDTGLERARQRNIDLLSGFKKKRPKVNFPKFTPTGFLADTFLRKPFQKFSDFLASKNRPFFEEVIRGGKIKGLNFGTVANMTEEELEDAYQDYMSERLAGNIDAYGNPINRGDRGDPNILLPQGIMTQAPSNMEEEPEYVNPLSLLTPRIAGSQFAADGGRIGFQGGGKDLGAGASGMGSGGKDRTRDKDGDPRDRRRVEQYKKPPSQTNPIVERLKKRNPPGDSPFKKFLAHDKFTDLMKTTNTPNYHQMGGFDFMARFPNINPEVAKMLASGYQNVFELGRAVADGPGGKTIGDALDTAKQEAALNAIGIDAFSDPTSEIYKQYTSDDFGLKPAAVSMAGGGIASLEDMDREGFLLGGIAKGLKKAVRGIKKLAKSPIGKAALGFAALQYGGGFGAGLKSKLFGSPALAGSGREFFMGMGGKSAATKGILGALGLTAGGGSMMPTALGGITLASLAAGAMTPKESKDKFDLDSYYASGQLNPSLSPRMMGSDFDFYGGRIASAEGGSTDKEPVAKKTMPLLDMGGKEMDLREEGGFVPIGRMEKADDVPARLSKNEFVFTADAVRNAGDGDVDKGAEVMYNMMKNLEAGGDVSEESQGLEGARKMFQTSQRLEEVL